MGLLRYWSLPPGILPRGAPELRLGEEFHHNGLAIRCAQIGRVPRGLAHTWDRARLAQETIALLQLYGALVRDHIIADVVPFDDAPDYLTRYLPAGAM